MARTSAALLAVWLGVLLGCSDHTANLPAKNVTPLVTTKSLGFPYQVLDRFDVGNQVVVRALAVDRRNKRMWVGTTVGALQIDLSNADFRVQHTYTRASGLANEYIFSILVSEDTGVWLGTNGGGVSQRHKERWRTYFPMHGLADYWVYSFAEQDPWIWIGTWAGLSRYDKRDGSFHTYLTELVNEWVYGLAVDSKGRLWVGTEGGLNMFDGQNWSLWTQKNGLGAANSAALPASRNTGLGTRNRHDLSVQAQGRATYNPNYVFCVLVDRQDRIWAGTWGGGVAVYSGAWKNFTRADGLGGNIVYSLAEDEQGRIWAGSDGGISVYVDRQWRTLNKSRGLGDDHVYAIATDQAQVWLGVRGAVLRMGELSIKPRTGTTH